MSKSAEEMFEELGYFYKKYPSKIIIFRVYDDSVYGLIHKEMFRFENIEKKWFFNPAHTLTINYANKYDIELFKAIQKQVEEFGWSD